MKESKNFSSKDEAINLLAAQYPRGIANNFLEKGFINDLIVEMSYGEEGLERKIKDLGLNILLDTKRTPAGEVRGFRGQMFVDSEYNIYIAIRGTSTDGIYTLLNNVNTDLAVIANGEFDKEYLKELNDFVKNVRNYSNSLPEVPKIYVHGHSLGGGGAQHVGLLLSMTAQEGQSVFTLTSDPIATEELSNKVIAAYKEIKANNDSMVVDIDGLIEKINSTEINAMVDKYFSIDEYDRYEARQKFIAQELKDKVKIINLIPAEKDGNNVHFSSAALIHRQPGISFISIRDAQSEKQQNIKVKDQAASEEVEDQSVFGSIARSLGSIFAAGFSYETNRNNCEEVVDRVAGLVENIVQNARVHSFSELMKADKFVAIDDSTVIHKGLGTQLQEKFRNNIDFNFLLQNATPISKTLDVIYDEFDEQKIRNKMKLVLSKIDSSVQNVLRKMQVSEGNVYPTQINLNLRKDPRREGP